MKIKTKPGITLVDIIVLMFAALFLIFWGHIAYGADCSALHYDAACAQYHQKVLSLNEDYAGEITWHENFAYDVTKAFVEFQSSIQESATDMNIVLSRQELADQIGFILESYEISILKEVKLITEARQASQEETDIEHYAVSKYDYHP